MAKRPERSNRPNYRQELTDQIIEMIESGTAPWQKPWNAKMGNALVERPMNGVTGRPYRGMNSLYLDLKAKRMGFSNDPRWMTFKQAQEKGWSVRKGEKGTQVEYWKFEDTIKVNDEVTGEEQKVNVKRKVPSVFYATVFHASQIEGIPDYEPIRKGYDWDVNVEAERLLVGSGARILWDQADKAYYTPSKDEIHLPPKAAFEREELYYSVALHELSHWTGHESRLNREIANAFGTENYAREELRVEMASLYLSYETGVPFDPGQHASYTGSWIKSLKEDKNEIFRAAKDAEMIADYVMKIAREKIIELTVEPERNFEISSEPSVAMGMPIQAAHAHVEWSRYSTNGYELSTQGDKRFSALNARLSDGRSIEEAYQLDVKGYRKFGDDWRLGKGKPPIDAISQDKLYEKYLGLWQQWAKENPELIIDLKVKSAGKILTDRFASTPINQARALADVINISNNALHRLSKVNVWVDRFYDETGKRKNEFEPISNFVKVINDDSLDALLGNESGWDKIETLNSLQGTVEVNENKKKVLEYSPLTALYHAYNKEKTNDKGFIKKMLIKGYKEEDIVRTVKDLSRDGPDESGPAFKRAKDLMKEVRKELGLDVYRDKTKELGRGF